MRRQCRGLSLVELMIALALGVLVSGGIMAVFRATADGRLAQEQLALLQDEGRFAITQIKNDLAMAGAQYCNNTGGHAHASAAGPYLDEWRAPTVYASDPNALLQALSDVTASNPVPPGAPYSFPSFLAMRGYDCTLDACAPMDPSNKRNASGLNIPAMGKAVDSRVIGASVITVRYLDSKAGWAISEGGGGSTLTQNADGSVSIALRPSGSEPTLAALQKHSDPLVMLADCSSAQIFATSGLSAGVPTSTGSNFVQPQIFQNMVAPRLFSVSRDFKTITYFLTVVDNGDGQGHTTGALVRRVNGGQAMVGPRGGSTDEIMRGIERLDFKYGVQQSDGTVHYYTAAQVDNSTGADCLPVPVPIPGSDDRGCLWRSVSLIEIDLLMDGQQPLNALKPEELAYSYAADGIFTPQSPTATGRKVTPSQQGFPLSMVRREFTAVVAVRNVNP